MKKFTKKEQPPKSQNVSINSDGTSGSETPFPKVLLDHFEDSGLLEDALRAMQVEYVPPNGDVQISLPVASARIWYFNLDGKPTEFYRLRALGDWTPSGESKPRRYAQAPRSGNHLYLPPLLDVPWRQVAAEIATPLFITEGEKKAACACLHGFSCIGLGGVWNWRSGGVPIAELNLFNWQGRLVHIAFDSPDVTTNPSVRHAMEQLASELRRRGAKVQIIVFPYSGKVKIGLDDFLVAQGTEAFDALRKDAIEYLDVIAEMNENFACVWSGAKALILRESRRADGTWDVAFAKASEVKPGLADKYVLVPGPTEDRRVFLFDYWLRSPQRRKYERVVFEPGGCALDEYNLWRGFSVCPQEGDCSLYLQHIRHVICQDDSELFQYVIGWMAHMVQHPGELLGTALVLRGKQGVGKGSFVHPIGALVRGHYLHVSSHHHLLGNFNSHTKDKLLFFADEAFWAGDKAAEGTLKALITEPTRMLERKGHDALVINNYTRLIIASNHDWVVPAGVEERRFVVLDVSAEHMQDTEYFGRLKTQMENGGSEALLDYLLKVDLSAIDLRKIPKTTALLDTKLASMSPVQRFWFECLSVGSNGGAQGTWGEIVPCANLYQLYSEHPAMRGQSRRATESELGKFLKRLVPGLTAVRLRIGGPNSRQERHWVFPSLEQCRASFCAELGQPVPWDETSTPEPKKQRKY